MNPADLATNVGHGLLDLVDAVEIASERSHTLPGCQRHISACDRIIAALEALAWCLSPETDTAVSALLADTRVPGPQSGSTAA